MNSVMSHPAEALLTVEGVRKAFPKPDGSDLLVLDGVNLKLEAGQIVGLRLFTHSTKLPMWS